MEKEPEILKKYVAITNKQLEIGIVERMYDLEMAD